MTNISIRKAVLSDLPELTEIYNQAIQKRQTADTTLMNMEERRGWFESHQSPKYPLYVAEEVDQVVGYASLSSYREGRPALRYAVEISYYIHKARQRRGIGSQLLEYALATATNLGYRNAFAILLDTNLPSIRLLEKFGFMQWGHLPKIAEIDGQVCGHYYYGRPLSG